MDGGDRATQEAKADDSMDGGGRATQEQFAEQMATEFFLGLISSSHIFLSSTPRRIIAYFFNAYKNMKFLNGLTLLLIFQLMGEITVLLFELTVPGPVLGMILLFVTLLVKDSLVDVIEPAGQALVSHLSLLFVPAGVGIMIHYDRIIAEWHSISLALLVSTIVTMAATAFVMLMTEKWIKRNRSEHDRK